jgi:hypothetical protein
MVFFLRVSPRKLSFHFCVDDTCVSPFRGV